MTARTTTLARGIRRGYSIAASGRTSTERSYRPMTATQVQEKAWDNVGNALRTAMDNQQHQ